MRNRTGQQKLLGGGSPQGIMSGINTAGVRPPTPGVGTNQQSGGGVTGSIMSAYNANRGARVQLPTTPSRSRSV